MPQIVIPAPRTPDPLKAPVLRWGILGPGKIATTFVNSLTRFTRQQVTAVASRSLDKARDFAKPLAGCAAFGSYGELVYHPAVDIVYVSTPHTSHYEHVMLALAGGKHVLVEKPFAVNAGQAKQMVRLAKDRNLFLMEAMWPRFLPAFDSVRQILEEGMIGEIIAVAADLGEYFPYDPAHRLYAPELGGGSLLDLGVYLVSLSSFLIGAPRRITARGQVIASGVDAQVTIILENGGGAQATLFTTLSAPTPTAAYIAGTKGTLRLETPFYEPPRITVTSLDRSQQESREFEVRTPVDGLCFEAAEAAYRIGNGFTESPYLPLQESVEVMEVLDSIRDQIMMSTL